MTLVWVSLRSGFRRGRVDGFANLRDTVCREPSLPGMFADQFLVRGDVDAVDLVIRNVAVQPLDLGTELAQHAAGSLRDGGELVGRHFTRVRNFALDDVFRHALSPGKIQGMAGNALVRFYELGGAVKN